LFLSSDTPTPPGGRALGGSAVGAAFSFFTSYATDSTTQMKGTKISQWNNIQNKKASIR